MLVKQIFNSSSGIANILTSSGERCAVVQEWLITMQHSRGFILLFVLFLSLIVINVKTNSAHASTTATFQPSADTWIDEQSPNALDLPNWILEVAVSNTSGTQQRERALVRFDISSIPAGSQILKATLSLFYYESIGNPYARTYWAYRLTQTAWDENLTNWNNYNGTNPWTTAGGDYTTNDGASTIVPRYFDRMTWNVTDQVETEYSSGSGDASFIIKDGSESVGENVSVGVDFLSRESGTSQGLEPILSVEYSTYSATINAHCNSDGSELSLGIIEDGSPTGFNTSYTFSDLTGTHTFTVQNTDSSGHSFKDWNTGENTTTISVSSEGTYTAYYQTTPGDLNADGKVGLDDLVILAHAYGSRLGDPNWNSAADIDGNGFVGLSDLVILAQHYGQ